MIVLVARMVFPFAFVLAIGLWAKGYAAVGDGFSAGATAGLGAMIQFVCREHREAARAVGARWAWHLATSGLLLTVAVAVTPVFFGAAPVTHLPRAGGQVIKIGVVDLHTALLFDLGVGVAVYGVLIGIFDRLFPPWRGESL